MNTQSNTKKEVLMVGKRMRQTQKQLAGGRCGGSACTGKKPRKNCLAATAATITAAAATKTALYLISGVPGCDKKARSEDVMSVVGNQNEDEMSVEPAEDSNNTTYEPHETSITTIGLREMPGKLSETLINAFNSPFSELTSELAIILNKYQNLMPAHSCIDSIFRFICKGPRDGNTFFPDPKMMDHVVAYLSSLMSVPGMKHHLAQMVADKYWEECLQQMHAVYYTADGDGGRIGSDALLRTSQSIHAKLCCADVFLQLLRAEMDFCIEDPTRCETQPIVKHMVAHRCGTKRPLEQAVSACAKLWVEHGHFIIGDKDLTTTDQPRKPWEKMVRFAERSTSQLFAERSTARLFETFGQICTYLAWLHGSVEQENAKLVARIIANCFLGELNQSQFDVSPFVNMTKDEYHQCVKLEFVKSLRNDLVFQLQPWVAKGLEISKLWEELHNDDAFFEVSVITT